MQTIKEAHGADAAYFGDRPDWLIAYAVTRDATIIDKANRESLLERLDPYGDDYAIERSGHWAVGWIDFIVVKPESKAHDIARQAIDEMSDYPILDDEKHSDMEQDAMQEIWDTSSIRRRIRDLAHYGDSIFAARARFVSELWDRAWNTYCSIMSSVS